MAKYILTNQAVSDLSDIWNYTFDTWSEKQADTYYNEIINECKSLVKNPEGAKAYFGLVSDLRGVKVNKHILFFRKLENEDIEIERILHERMDIKTQLRNIID